MARFREGPRRIVVVGNCGAGKSWLSMALAARLGLPLEHLDRHYWRPGWRTPAPEDWRATVATLAAADRWVLDGNYGGTFDLRLPRADLIVWLDPHPIVCEYRALARFWKGRRQPRPDVADGCQEQIDWLFLRYIWSYRRRHAPRLVAAVAEHAPRDLAGAAEVEPAGTPLARHRSGTGRHRLTRHPGWRLPGNLG